MSDPEIRPTPPELAVAPDAAIADEDVPARRLLAHDLEHLVWDHDGEDASPPPD